MSIDPAIKAFMRASLDAGKKSVSEGGVKPKVGVVIVRDGQRLGESYRGETGSGRHAEFGLIEKLGAGSIRGATVYTTLEPCSQRNHPKAPCAERLINAGVSTIYIGMYDPNPAIYLVGWKMLRDGGIMIRDYPDDLREEIRSDNREFVESYKVSIGERGSARFDYTQNGGKYRLEFKDVSIETSWTNRGNGSIYAISNQYHVAIHRYARDFGEIDNPGALDWGNYTVGISVGQIGVFRSEYGYALVKVIKVIAGDGKGHTELQFDYEIRSKKQYEHSSS